MKFSVIRTSAKAWFVTEINFLNLTITLFSILLRL